jgi:hypothetical protein
MTSRNWPRQSRLILYAERLAIAPCSRWVPVSVIRVTTLGFWGSGLAVIFTSHRSKFKFMDVMAFAEDKGQCELCLTSIAHLPLPYLGSLQTWFWYRPRRQVEGPHSVKRSHNSTMPVRVSGSDRTHAFMHVLTVKYWFG